MSYPYDIPYMRNPKDGDYALQMLLSSNDWSLPLNYSRKISYLKGKMKAHRDQCTNLEEATYRIIDEDGNVYFTQTFKKACK